MFYDKEITIVREEEGYLNDEGRWVDGELKPIKTIECDVQPFSSELARKTYGYEEVVQYRIFLDPDNQLETDGTIRYKGEDYKIKRIVPWDSYWILLVSR
ncbi:MAG TPA: head-tail adaptor protein [Tissierellia bacterium]|nr:head-tail adaptor protein [Tissierellia bacterium]